MADWLSVVSMYEKFLRYLTAPAAFFCYESDQISNALNLSIEIIIFEMI